MFIQKLKEVVRTLILAMTHFASNHYLKFIEKGVEIMSDSLRKSVITIDWKINNESLEKANRETDELISRVGRKAEHAFNKTQESIEKSSGTLKKHNVVLIDTAKGTDTAKIAADSARDSFVTMGNKSKDSISKLDAEIDNVADSIEKTENEIVSARNEFSKLGDASKTSLNKADRGALEVSKSLIDIENNSSSAKNKIISFASTFSSKFRSAKGDSDKVSRSIDGIEDELGSARRSSNTFEKSFKGNMSGAENAVEKVGASVDRTFSRVRNLVAGLAIGHYAKEGVVSAFSFASDLTEELGKSEIVFGDQSAAVREWSSETIQNYGLAQVTALELVATFGDMSTSMGLSQDEAAKMSTSMVGLAGDLASFKNMDIDRAYTALNGVFTGETEALKSLGIVMTQTNLEQYALAQGFDKSIKDMSQAELVQLRYSYVMAQTANAQGDFARTSDQAANSTRVFGETAKEFASNAGQALLPLFTPVIQFGSKMIGKLNENVPKWEKALEPYSAKIAKTLDWIEDRVEKFPDSLKRAAERFDPVLRPAKRALESAKDFIVDTFIPTVGELASSMGPGFMDAGIWAFETIGTVIDDYAKPAFEWLKEYSEDNPGQMREIAKGASTVIGGLLLFNTVHKPISGAIGLVSSLLDAIDKLNPSSDKASGWIKKIFPSGGAKSTGEILPNVTASTLTTGAGANAAKVGLGTKVGTFAKGIGAKTAGLATGVWGGAKSLAGWLSGSTQALSAYQSTNILPVLGQATKGGSVLNALKNVGSVGKAGAKSIPGLNWLLAGVNLIGMNKENAGEKLGNSGGMLAGGGMGAAIGTAIAPGIGTAIGAMAGTFAGSEFGAKFGEYVQKNWSDISNFGDEHAIIGAPIRFINNTIDAAKDGWETLKGIFEDPLENNIESDLSDDGVSAKTSKKVANWLEGQNELDTASQQRQYTGEGITEAEHKESASARDEQSQTIVDAFNEKESASNQNINLLQEFGVLGSDSASKILDATDKLTASRVKSAQKLNGQLKELEQKQYEEQLAITQKYEEQINGIKEKAKEEGRTLTEKELAEINRLEELRNNERKGIYEKYEPEITRIQEEQKTLAIEALSASAEEQKIILGRLADSTEELSAKQAADIVKNSASARDGAIQAANEKYDQVIAAAEEEYYVHGSISKEQFEEIKKNAEAQRDSSISAAEEMHEGVVDQAKKQAEGHLKMVDWETGETLSTWNRFIAGFASVINTVTGGVNWVLGKLGMDIAIPKWTPAGYNNNTGRTTAPITNTATAMYYSGTSAAYGGSALVGEEGFELAYDKSASKAMILGANGPEVTQIKSGTRILNHRDSVKLMTGGLGAGQVLPGFNEGNSSIQSFASNVWEGAKNIGGKIADGTRWAWEWVKDPAGKFTEMLNNINPFNQNSENTMELVGAGGIKTVGAGAKKWIVSKLQGIFSVGSSGQVNSWITEAMGIAGVPASWAGPLATIAMKESGGNPNAVNNWDINAKNGIPSKGLMQTIEPTFNAHKASGYGNIFNPVDNILASINYIRSRYGDVFNVPGIRSMAEGGSYVGYAKGGKASRGETFIAGENGPELITAQDPTTILPNSLTSKLLGKKESPTVFEFKPQFNIKIEGGGNADDIASKVERAVTQQTELMYEKLRRMFDPGVVY